MLADDSKRYQLFLIFALFVNLISSGLLFFLAFSGSVFYIFSQSIKRKYYYTLFFAIAVFCFIEAIEGLPLFSLSLVSAFIVFFIKPFIKNIFSSGLFVQLVYLGIFYLLLIFILLFKKASLGLIYKTLLVNLFFDIFFTGFLL
ncbi:MAG: hypothetical protein IE909_02210 [Campylobacterales bacterium]|nr:hypothetical protein [Campylobacterales bacterium]